MNYELIKNPYNQKLSLLETVLTNRGIKIEDIENYLSTTEDDILDPKNIKNIDQGAKLLISHIKDNHDIFIQVDADADGFTSAAVLINYLNKLFPSFVINHIKYRVHDAKQHGIILETIPENIKLVVIPDAGSNQYEEHKILRDNGIDVLVIDHHEAEYESPDACIINNQLCDYPTKSLSGVGMVYKLCCYIDQFLPDCEKCADEFRDLVSLGLISDMMPLIDFETRHLVDTGLMKLNNGFFKHMAAKQAFSLKGELTPFGIAFYITPYINATIRAGTLEEKYLLFESMLDHRGNEKVPSTKRGHAPGEEESIIEQACRNSTNIKNRQSKAEETNLEIIERKIEENNLLQNKILIVKFSESDNINKNLTGLFANQLMAKYHRPVLLLSEHEGNWEGSARGISNTSFDSFKDFINSSNLANWAQGHANAFGASFTEENLNNFIFYTNDRLKECDFSANYKVDFIYNCSDNFGPDVLKISEYKSIWGQGIEEPYIAIENIKITPDNIKLMAEDRNPTLRIDLPSGVSLIKFKSNREEFEKLKPEEGYISINIVGRCEANVWNGKISPQITIKDFEITSYSKFYF